MVNVLCGYLRAPFDLPGDPPDTDADKAIRDEHHEQVQEREVRLTAQRILTTPLCPGSDLDLTGAVLVDLNLNRCHIHTTSFINATFTGTAGFDGATFTGTTPFNKATFTGLAWLDEATFTGTAWLDEATFTETAWFIDATFTGHTYFSKVKFAGQSRIQLRPVRCAERDGTYAELLERRLQSLNTLPGR